MGKYVSSEMEYAVNRDLLILNSLSKLHGRELAKIDFNGEDLPDWDISDNDLPTIYHDTVKNVELYGFGIFAKYNVFRMKAGKLVTVNNPDPQKLDSLYEYKNNKMMLYDNTLAFLDGVPASNALLYGAAGTGKSSTVKAVCNALFDKGLRLIEMDINEIKYIPDIVEEIAETPLKFIFFIDDLSISTTDENYCILKGILEGNSSSYHDNALIYVTSNRRHLIDENHADRVNSSIHLNDTLQENMSLSARFGLTLTYLKPDRDTFVIILENLLAETDLDITKEDLIKGAEAYAIRQNGRSPRTAKQYIKKLLVENKKSLTV